jgi:hypothetical protein
MAYVHADLRASVEEAKGFWRPSTILPHVPVDVTPGRQRLLNAPETYTISVGFAGVVAGNSSGDHAALA